jgi:hypothetical protein
MSTTVSAGRVRKPNAFIEANRRDFGEQPMCRVLRTNRRYARRDTSAGSPQRRPCRTVRTKPCVASTR